MKRKRVFGVGIETVTYLRWNNYFMEVNKFCLLSFPLRVAVGFSFNETNCETLSESVFDKFSENGNGDSVKIYFSIASLTSIL